MQTTRALLGATVVVGGFITTLMTRWLLLISFQAAVGSLVNGCTAIGNAAIVGVPFTAINTTLIVNNADKYTGICGF